MEKHKHCVSCGNMIPEKQEICFKCAEALAKEEPIRRESYYTSFVGEVPK